MRHPEVKRMTLTEIEEELKIIAKALEDLKEDVGYPWYTSEREVFVSYRDALLRRSQLS